MTVLQGVLTSAGLVAVLMGLIWRMFVHFDAKNEQAHATIDDRAERRAEAHRAALEAMNERVRAITANVPAVDDRAERRAEAHRAALESIARDVSFLAGRPAERDRRLSVRRCLRVNLVVLPGDFRVGLTPGLRYGILAESWEDRACEVRTAGWMPVSFHV